MNANKDISNSYARTYSYIRFSTPDQLKGDSLRRQRERSEAYAKKNNLQIDDSLKLEDLGISAYKGKNSTEGALAGFLSAVEMGQVPKGSTLLVESLDRLSRNHITEALTQFLKIINAGITVVTLIDEKSFNTETINNEPLSLFGSLVIMIRAHEESATKADRISRSWNEKRRKATIEKKPLTRRCPAWLELKNGKYKKINERVKLIVRIFELASKGLGKRSIAKIFNTEKIETWGDGINKSRKANGWHDSYIQKILNNESVLGVYQPHHYPKDSYIRTPIGEPIENYFPQIISPLLWQSVHKRARSPKGAKGGGGKLSNLFTGLVFDGYTGSVMRFVNKGNKRGHGKYLTSDIKRIDPNSKGQSWSYHHFETAILNHLISFDWSKLSRNDVNSEISNLQEREAELQLHNSLLEKQLDSLIDDFSTESSSVKQQIKNKIDKIGINLDENKRELLIIQSNIEIKKDNVNAITDGVKVFKDLATSNDLENRVRLQYEISRRIKKINIYRYGGLPKKYELLLKKGYTPTKSSLEIIHHSGEVTILTFSKIIPMNETKIRSIKKRIQRVEYNAARKQGLSHIDDESLIAYLIKDRKITRLEAESEVKAIRKG